MCLLRIETCAASGDEKNLLSLSFCLSLSLSVSICVSVLCVCVLFSLSRALFLSRSLAHTHTHTFVSFYFTLPPRLYFLCPETGLPVPRWAYSSRDGPIRPEAGLSVARRAYLIHHGADTLASILTPTIQETPHMSNPYTTCCTGVPRP